jgi:hypothetical protein
MTTWRGRWQLAGTVGAGLSALALVVLLAASPPPAGAHSEAGEMTVIVAEQVGSAVRVEVGIVFTTDGRVAEEATVTATLSDPAGSTVGPQALARISGGRYGADVPVSAGGPWTATVSSTDPAASAEQPVTVEEPVATTTSAPVATTTTTGAPSTDLASSSTESPSGGTSPWVWVAVAVVALALAVVAGVAVGVTRSRSRPGGA